MQTRFVGGKAPSDFRVALFILPSWLVSLLASVVSKEWNLLTQRGAPAVWGGGQAHPAQSPWRLQAVCSLLDCPVAPLRPCPEQTDVSLTREHGFEHVQKT